jgi:RNA polymerase sigma factor (sigma-70 family)
MAAHTLNRLVGRLRQSYDPAAPADSSDGRLLDRFRRDRDPAAFETLLRRYGPTVLAACRKVLADPSDVDDAFQATFLTLLRNPAAVRDARSLGGWLYGVAHRTALRARSARMRRDRLRPNVVARRTPPPADDPAADLSWREACGTLHAELDRLGDPYRLPLLLCYLEGLTRDEAAARLGCSVGVLRGRLERGREKLRRRLVRRGVTLSAGLLAAVGQPAAADGPSPTLLHAALAAASEGPSSAVAALITGDRLMTSPAVKLLAAVALLAGAVFALAGRPGPTVPDPPQPGEKPAPAPTGSLTYAGRILDADGKPIAGAKVLICGLKPGVIEFAERATAGPDGSFRFTVRRDEFGDKGVVPPSRSPPERYVHVAASAAGHGSATALAGQSEQRESLTIRLPPEEAVTGRVIDLQGQPLPRVKVYAHLRYSRWDLQGRPAAFDAPDDSTGSLSNIAPFDEARNSAVTGADGRFTLRGLGRGWLYDLYLTGPAIVNGNAQLVARPEKPARVGGTGLYVPGRGDPKLTRFGSDFTYVATPSKPIRGVVRETGSGRPVAGARVYTPFVRDDDPQASTTTDPAGRYELTGLPGGTHTLHVDPPQGAPYLETEFTVDATRPGTEPVTADFEVPRRPTVAGRVTDRVSGRPVAGWVEYRPLAANPNLATAPLLATPRFRQHVPTAMLDPDGRFKLPVLPGPGVLLVRAEGDYLSPRLEKAHRSTGVAVKEDPELIDTRPHPAQPNQFQAYHLLDAPADTGTPVSVAIALTPDRERPLLIEFPDGKPQDVGVIGLHPVGTDRGDRILADTRSAVCGLEVGEPRRLFLETYDRRFAAAVTVDGSASGPVAVKLQPTGTVIGRLLDKNGRPLTKVAFQELYDDGPGRPGVMIGGGFVHRVPTPAEYRRATRITGMYGDKMGHATTAEYTAADGRFRLTGLVPGVAFDLRAQMVAEPNEKGQRFISGYAKVARPTVKPGETLDLGELRVGEVERE